MNTNNAHFSGEAIDKLAAYEDAEEQGLLLRLPCKMEDTLYEISLVEPYRNPAIRQLYIKYRNRQNCILDRKRSRTGIGRDE